MKTRTLATTVRCDARDAAMAHHLLVKQGINPTSISDLFRECISVVAELAVYKEMVQKIDSTAEAVGYLQRHGVIDLLDNTDRPNRATLVKILAEEDGMRVYDDVLPEDIKKAVQERLAKDEENLFILRSITPTEVVDDD